MTGKEFRKALSSGDLIIEFGNYEITIEDADGDVWERFNESDIEGLITAYFDKYPRDNIVMRPLDEE